MPDGERDASALSPEEIGERAAAIARSLERLRRCDAQMILSFAASHLSGGLVDDRELRFSARRGQ
jgi:hypothetical protein